MRKSTALVAAAAVVVILALGILIPALLIEPKTPTNLPWQVEVDESGALTVFGVTLGETTLREVEQRFGESEVTLFRSPEGSIAVEAYFDTVNLSGLDAKIVLGLRVPAQELEAMYQRGVRSKKLGSGARGVILASADRRRMDHAVISSLTYIPSIQLDPQLITKRFGEPAEKWKEKEGEVVHWLYPRVGLDVALSEHDKEVLQYVLPADFARLREPLMGGERVP